MHIKAEELKKYVADHRSCNFTPSGCVLGPRNSMVSLDFSFINHRCDCVLFVKRKNGNGKLSIRSGGSTRSTFARSTTERGLSVELGSDHKVDVLRVADCSGELVLCGVELKDLEESPNLPTSTATAVVPAEMSWNAILKTCGGYRGLKLSGDVLYASEGAMINAAKIECIETEPPNVITRKGRNFKFIYPCQILSIVLDGSIQLPDPKYVHMQRPASVTVLDDKTPSVPASDIVQPLTSSPTEDIYDSKGTDLFSIARSMRGIEKHGSGVLMRRDSEFSIPIPRLSSKMLYTFAINAYKKNGNGKAEVELVDTNGVRKDTVTVVLPPSSQAVLVKLNTGEEYDKHGYRLKIFRLAQGSVGEVIVSRIRAVQGQPTNLAPPVVLPQVDHTTQTPPPKTLLRKTTDYALTHVNEDIKNTFKHYSVLSRPAYPDVETYGISCPLKAVGYSAEQWLNKVAPIFPKITNKTSNVAVCSIDDLVPAPVVWLEEFDHNVTREQLSLLVKTDIIYTPSLHNLYTLRRWLPGKNVQLQHRPWPILGARDKIGKHYIYLEKDKNVTDMLLRLWTPVYPPLYVVGVRCHVPDHIHYISEYEPYQELYKLISTAHGIIDISPNSHYISGVLELARALGLQMVTNNHRYLSYTPFIVRNSRGDKEYYVRASDIQRAITYCLKGAAPVKKSEYKIKTVMSRLLEIKW